MTALDFPDRRPGPAGRARHGGVGFVRTVTGTPPAGAADIVPAGRGSAPAARVRSVRDATSAVSVTSSWVAKANPRHRRT